MTVTRASVDILTEPPPPSADARIAYGPEPLQFGDLRVPRGAGPYPLVVVIHGGYWQAIYNLTHAGHLCIDLVEHGVATWNIEYRRLGDVGGGWPATGADVLSALDHVRELERTYPLDLERVVAIGHSAGGQLAVWSSLHTALPLCGVISLAGVVDLHALAAQGADHGLIARLLGGDQREAPEHWRDASPVQHLPWPIRTVLACGTADVHWGPNEGAAQLARAAGSEEVELLPLPDAGHFELIDPQAPEWSVIRMKILDLLRLGD